MPHKHVQLALERPGFRRTTQTGAYRIVSNIAPFFGVIFTATKLSVPKRSLPDGLFVRSRPMTGNSGFPIVNPISQRRILAPVRSAKQMDMIRHDDIAANMPSIRRQPYSLKQIVNIRFVEEQPPVVRTNREENDRRSISHSMNRLVSGSFSGGARSVAPVLGPGYIHTVPSLMSVLQRFCSCFRPPRSVARQKAPDPAHGANRK